MSRQRGLALVSVLWGVAILSLIAAAMLSASVTSAHLARNGWAATRANAAADAAVNQAILSLLDTRSRRQPRVDATPTTLAFDGTQVRLWIQDESGKINVNFAARELLQRVFLTAGLDTGDAAGLAERIVASRPTQSGSGTHIAFRALDDLLAVPGMNRALLARVAPALTVYGKSGGINQQIAPRETLRVLPDMDPASIDRILKVRDEAYALRQTADDSVAGGALGIADAYFVVTAEARVDGARVVRLAAVQFTGDPARPYLIVAWR